MARKPNGNASISDVARLAGVSTQTVSRVANGSNAVRPATRERVLDAMEQLGYRPSFAARSLRAGRYRSVGLAMPCDISATGRRFQLEGIATAAAEHQYALTLVQICDDVPLLAGASRRMAALPVDGQILGLGSDPNDFESFVPPSTIPTVIISTRPHPRCATVSNDQVACSVDIVNYLVGMGHREIRYAGGRREAPANLGRVKGWEQSMRAHGLTLREPLFGDWTADSGYRLGTMLARDEQCTAIYAGNDAMAVGIILALREAGKRVPEDVSVMGVDDSMVGVIPRLELSSYRFDDERVGAVAFDLAVNAPATEEPPHILVRGVLVERSTVAPPRNR
jgi:DNA-binding LacI/PurR family transcriptional regulator